MIRAGSLRTLLEIQAKTTTGTGMDEVTAWATVSTVWAEMWAVRGDERAAAATTQATISHRVRMYAYPGLAAGTHRFQIGTSTFNISFINDVERRGVEYVVDCLEIVGEAAQ